MNTTLKSYLISTVIFIIASLNVYALNHTENTSNDDEEAVEYYDLSGNKVANPTKGVYIRRQGKNISRVTFDGKSSNIPATKKRTKIKEHETKPVVENIADQQGQKPTKPVSINKKDKSYEIIDIAPQTDLKANNTFAVIIGNEDYAFAQPVKYASNDASVFADYCSQTLGIPQNQIKLYKNASSLILRKALKNIQTIADAFDGDINILFYYAGHGIPSDKSGHSYLMPIDAEGNDAEFCMATDELFSELALTEAKSVIVFLDACFSGANRGNGMLRSARGVRLKPKEMSPKGNMMILSASSEDEAAFPLEDQKHGLFTYCLLKKLNETKGKVSLKELAEHVKTNVRRISAIEMGISQTPSITISGELANKWQDLNLIQ